ncbi:FBD-associated F-box protein At3g52670-like [Rutidosis leptorrhynchoides]|uniref:FBD-associated F-box protein At3g52670-like n=1 Tax=Rutidosis leptorrhynchoides TaxID=125765 RepID=UPI003A9A475D
MNVESDRLSNLSDDLIHKILSYIDTKQAIKTSILSSRWKNTWKSIPHLVFSSHDHNSILEFSESVNRVLLSRNHEIDLSYVKLSFYEKVSQAFLKTVMNYSFLHNVQKMTIICSHNERHREFPLSLFSSQSLKDLTLIGLHFYIKITSSWDLLALATLHLESVFVPEENAIKFGGLFSKCPNLKSLSLTTCRVDGRNGFTISHSNLSNLTLKNGGIIAKMPIPM